MRTFPLTFSFLLLPVLVCLPSAALRAQEAASESVAAEASAEAAVPVPAAWSDPLDWRSIGPANMGGRITSLAVPEGRPGTFYVGTAAGGVLKTINNGVTFEHLFTHQPVASIGDVAVAPSNAEIVWVGTGEANPRNSVSFGNGVYRSLDGGKTFEHMGLDKTFQISRVVIHPRNPDIVYVGALGRLWGPNSERGLYKTTDGGKTWEKILFVDDDTGVIEVRMHPEDPETLLVATYVRRRDIYCTNDPAVKCGEGAGLWKTSDGGKTWKRITEGLPTCNLGRIGIDYYRANPDIVFMVLESEEIGKAPENAAWIGVTGENADAGARILTVVKDGPAAKSGLKQGDVVISADGAKVLTYDALLDFLGGHVSGDTVKLEVARDGKSVELEMVCGKRPSPKPRKEKEGDGEGRRRRPRRPTRPYGTRLGGQRPNIQRRQGKDGHQYGGIYKSVDGGETWKRINSCNPRPMYFSQIRVDPSDENHVYVLGISCYRSNDGGRTFTADHARGGVHVDHHALWIDPRDGRHQILGNDGGIYVTWDRGAHWDHLNHVAIGQFYHVAVDPRRDYRVYGGLQDNGSWGGPAHVRHGRGPANADWVRVGGGDGFVCRVDPEDPDLVYFESQNGGLGRLHLRSGERGRIRPRAPRGRRYRFNWDTPFILSHHNPRIYYVAGNHVFRSLDRGEGLRRISPEIPLTKKGTATALAESPLDPDLLYVGTDDGALFATENGGHTWKDLFAPPPATVTRAPGGESEVAGKGTEEQATPPAESRPSGAPGTKADSDEEERDPPPEGAGRAASRPAGEGAARRRFRGGRGRGFLRRLLENDANGDGRIERSEVPPRMMRLFERLDANGDDVIDAAEAKAARERFAARSRRGRGAPERAAPAKREKAAPAGKPLQELLPGRRYVSSIVPSRFTRDRVYVVFDGHRSDDDAPHVLLSEDAGETWRRLDPGLPDGAGPARVIAEDPANENLLYLGTEFGFFVSCDRGQSWFRPGKELPTVPVHDVAIHEACDEIIVATHGRSLWILDANPLRRFSREVLAAEATLFKPQPAVIWRREPSRGGTLRSFVGENRPSGARIWYGLAAAADPVLVTIEDAAGKVIRKIETSGKKGLNLVTWDLRETPRARRSSSGRQGFRGRGGRFFRRRGRRVSPGTYRVVLEVAGKRFESEIRVEVDPAHPDGIYLESEELREEMEAEVEEREEPFPNDG